MELGGAQWVRHLAAHPILCMCSASSVTKYPEFVENRLRGFGARCEDPQPGAIGSGPHQYGDVTGDPWRWVLTG